MTEKQKAIVADVLKQNPYLPDFQIVPDEMKERWEKCVNQVPVISFNSGKYDLNVVKKYFVKNIANDKKGECKEDVFVAKNKNGYMFLILPKFNF